MTSALAPKLRSVITDHLAQATPDELARVVGAIAGNGRAETDYVYTWKKVESAFGQPAPAGRFVQINAAGHEVLDPQDGEPVAVYDRTTGLTWSRGNVGGKRLEHAAAAKACADLTLAGRSDWRLPTIQELLSIVDYSKHGPAIDVGVFDCESAWYWTSTPCAWAAGAAWIVYFVDGHSLYDGRDYAYCVRAVRSGQ